MMELCPYCGGLLKPIERGFRCPHCSSVFDSKSELASIRPKKATPTMRANISVENSSQQEIHSNIELPTRGDSNRVKSDSGVAVFDSNITSVLEITWTNGGYKHSGSGFLISKDGYAITNTHVVTSDDGTSCQTVKVKLCNQSTTAEVIRLGDDEHGAGSGIDLALIKLATVPENATVVRFEAFDKVRNGERVFVIGNSLGYGTCITSGIVSDKTRKVNGKMLLMTDCAVNNGNSGGPIFNEKGLVIGAIVSGITNAEGMNFAIPSDAVQEFIKYDRKRSGFPLLF